MNRDHFSDTALLLLRLGGLGLALAHGYGKVAALATGHGAGFIAGVESLGFPLPVLFAWAAALGEFAGGLFVAVGLGTRIAAAFATFTMFVAGFVRHHALQHLLAATGAMTVPEDTLRSWGNPELALVYLLVFGAVLLAGGGRFSLDHLLARPRSGIREVPARPSARACTARGGPPAGRRAPYAGRRRFSFAFMKATPATK